jgi:hypothetical protein
MRTRAAQVPSQYAHNFVLARQPTITPLHAVYTPTRLTACIPRLPPRPAFSQPSSQPCQHHTSTCLQCTMSLRLAPFSTLNRVHPLGCIRHRVRSHPKVGATFTKPPPAGRNNVAGCSSTSTLCNRHTPATTQLVTARMLHPHASNLHSIQPAVLRHECELAHTTIM